MNYLRAYIRNLFILVLVICGMLIFMKIFYPDALSLFPLMGQLVGGLNLWPIVILLLLAAALPYRRR